MIWPWSQLNRIEETLNMVAASLEELEKEIARTANVNQAVLALIKDMIERLEELAKHPTADAIKALTAQLRAHTSELATAVSDHEE